MGHPSEDSADVNEVVPDPAGPFVALCVKALIGPFPVQLSVSRVLWGAARDAIDARNTRSGRTERFDTLYEGHNHQWTGRSRETSSVWPSCGTRRRGTPFCDPLAPVVLL